MNTILHLGLPKTGSTFLQLDVFRYSKDINFISRRKGLKQIYNEIRNVDKEINIEKVKKQLSNYLADDMTNLISEENFYCNMFTQRDDRFILLERINQLFPEAKIMLGIRNKKKLLVSWYKQYVAVGGTLKFDEFIEKVMNLNKLNYESYIDKLKELYGKENLFVFKFEKLLNEREKTVKNMCNFIGCKVPPLKVWKRNVGYGKTEIKIALLLNRFFKNQVNKTGIPYPYNHFLLPHRYVFQSRIFSWVPRKKVKLDELIHLKETKNGIESIFNK